MKWTMVLTVRVLLAGGPAAGGAAMYVCGSHGQVEYRDDAKAANCRESRLAPVGVVTRGKQAGAAPNVVAPPQATDDDMRAARREQLAAERKRIEALRNEYKDGEPERRGDERNYEKYRQRAAALKAALEDSEAKAAALQQQLDR